MYAVRRLLLTHWFLCVLVMICCLRFPQGKQTPEMSSNPSASLAPREQCLSLVSSSTGVSLDLWASSEQEVGAWVKAIRHILSSSGSSVADSNKAEVPAGRGGSRRISIMSTSLGGSKAEVGEAAFLSHMARGGVVTMHEGPGKKSTVTLFYVPEFEGGGPRSKSLCWVKLGAAKKPVDSQRIPLSSIKDVHVGLGTPSFKLLSASQAGSPSHCFSLTLRSGRNFDLEAVSEPERNSWLAGLKVALTSGMGKKVVETGEPLRPAPGAAGAPTVTPSRRMSFLPGASAPLKSAIGRTGLALSGADLYRLLLEGRGFTAFSTDNKGLTRSQRVWVFFRPDESASNKAAGVAGKTGALCWVPLPEGQAAPQGEPQVQAGCFIKMGEITDIFLGKQVLVMQSALAASAPANCCLSILSSLNSLNIQAASPRGSANGSKPV